MSARKASRKNRGAPTTVPEPDLTPIMNLSFMLILALLILSAAFPLGLIGVQAPRLGGGGGTTPPPDGAKPLQLTIFVTNAGFSIGASGATLDGAHDDPPRPGQPLFPKKDVDGKLQYDTAALQKRLRDIKRAYPNEVNVLIIADEDVQYDDIIKVMDISRETEPGANNLFPGVAFSAGIVG